MELQDQYTKQYEQFGAFNIQMIHAINRSTEYSLISLYKKHLPEPFYQIPIPFVKTPSGTILFHIVCNEGNIGTFSITSDSPFHKVGASCIHSDCVQLQFTVLIPRYNLFIPHHCIGYRTVISPFYLFIYSTYAILQTPQRLILIFFSPPFYLHKNTVS